MLVFQEYCIHVEMLLDSFTVAVFITFFQQSKQVCMGNQLVFLFQLQIDWGKVSLEPVFDEDHYWMNYFLKLKYG